MAIRTNPYRIHLPPEEVQQYNDIPFLYAICRGQIQRDYFENCCVNKKYASNWSLYYGEDVTIISYDDDIYSTDKRGFNFYPLEDLEVVLGMITEDLITDDEIDWKQMPHLYPNGTTEIENAAKNGDLDWLYPVLDVTNEEDPYWLGSSDALAGHMQATKHTADRESIFELISEQGQMVSGSMSIPEDPMERKNFFGVDHYIGDTGEEMFETLHHPLGIAPPVDPEEVIGETFAKHGKRWEIVKCYEPISPNIGWMFEIRSHDDFVSGLTQFAYEHLFEDAELNDMVPWYTGTVTYLELFGEYDINYEDGLDWTRYHRRKYLQSQSDDVVKVKEYRDHDFYISKYEWNGSRYERTRRKQWDTWKKQRTLNKLKDQSSQSKLDRLKELAGNSKGKDSSSSKKSSSSTATSKQIDALKKLID
jgi:hypothetical protein